MCTHTHTHTPLKSACMLFSCSVVPNSAIPWTAARQVSLSSTIAQSLLKFMAFESVMPSNHLMLCHPACRCSRLKAELPLSGLQRFSCDHTSGHHGLAKPMHRIRHHRGD